MLLSGRICRTVLIACAALLAPLEASATLKLPPIMISNDGHMLITAAGKPFFWLGDTAWELLHRATPDETRFYLRTRARQGFTIVQTVVLAELDGVRAPTPDGLTPFVNGDPAHPNEAYFDHVAFVVDEAASMGLYVALLPAWGDKLTAPWGDGPRLFPIDHPDIARAYGRYLGGKLKGRTNIVWMLGGDRPAVARPGLMVESTAKAGFAKETDWTPVWHAMADGLREGNGAALLTAYHPQGGDQSTSVVLRHADWLSINGMQSGHNGGRDLPVWKWVARDYAARPAKPTLDLEPNYEDHPFNPWPEWDPATGWFRDDDVRRQVWRSVLAGAAGVTYGHHAVWQWASARNPTINHVDRDWVSALHRPGAEQMRYLRDLLLSRPYVNRAPDPALIVGDSGSGGRHVVAARGDGYAIVYVPASAESVTIDLPRLGAGRVKCWWYDPRSGKATPISEMAGNAPHSFTAPPYGPDWVLMLDDASRGFAQPGFPLPAPGDGE